MKTDFYNLLGGFYWWLFVKFCQTKLADEQNEINKVRNLVFVSFVNIIIIVFIIIYLNKY